MEHPSMQGVYMGSNNSSTMYLLSKPIWFIYRLEFMIN